MNPIARSLIQLNILFLGFQRCAFAADQVAFGREVLSVLLPLTLVIAALIVTLLFMHKRTSIGKAHGPIKVVQVLAVGQRERVVVLQDGDRIFAVGVATASVNFLTELNCINDDINAD